MEIIVLLFVLVIPLLVIVGILMAIRDFRTARKITCPFCFEPIYREAIKCPHCQSLLDERERRSRTPSGTWTQGRVSRLLARLDHVPQANESTPPTHQDNGGA